MKDLKKCNIIRRIFFFATLLLSLAALARGRDDGICSNAVVAGTWGYTETGTLILSTGAVPFAAVGRYTLDGAGNFSATQTSSLGGSVGENTLKGTATVNSQCTGTLTVDVFDQSGNLLRTAVLALVYVDNAREVRAIVTSLVLANDTALPPVITFNAKKLFPYRGNDQ
jgi:hypothetical protein